MEKKLRLTTFEDNDGDQYDPADFKDIHAKVQKTTKFCWGCEHTLYPNNKNPNIKQMYIYFREKKGYMPDEKIAEHLHSMCLKFYPTSKFTAEEIMHHFNFHMHDLFHELHLQIERANTKEAYLLDTCFTRNAITGRIEPDHESLKSCEMITNKKIILLEKLHKYKLDNNL